MSNRMIRKNIHINKALHERLLRVKHLSGLGMADLIRRAIEAYLNNNYPEV